MFRTLALLLPALIPSWRFFPRVGPSPRVEYALLARTEDAARSWQEFRPRPDRVPLYAMLGRLVWNRRWNETLFVVTCAGRFLDTGSERTLREILTRIRSDLRRVGAAGHIQMRLVLVTRDRDRIVREEVYRSAVHPLDADRRP